MEKVFQETIPFQRSFKKRVFDLAFSSFFILLSLPFWILIPLLIKTISRGPVFFRSRRVGRGSREVICYKFRSMFSDAEEKLQKMLQTDPEKREEWQANYKLKNDPRVTWVGKFLRKSSLDELPQFFNVFKGELSIVGPRPITADELLRLDSHTRAKILSIKPGITGLWQTSGRSNMEWNDRIALELHYIDNHSLLLDLYLLLKTIPSILFCRGAY